MARSIGRFAGERVTLGAREVDDDLRFVFEFGMDFVLDGGEGTEEQVAGVGHDGGAARVDAIVGLKAKEAGKEVVDGDGGFEFGETGDEFGGEVGGLVAFIPTAGVVGAESGAWIGDGHAAAAFAGVVLAAAIGRSCKDGRFVDRIGVSRCVTHDMPRFPEK
jgi:hypothetical protein